MMESEAPLHSWESVDDVCDTTVRTCYHAIVCYPCVYGAAVHRAAYNTRFHVPLCTPSGWWCAGTVPGLGVCCLRAALGSLSFKTCVQDTACCICTGAPCGADEYRTHDAELHNLLSGNDSSVLPLDHGILGSTDGESLTD